MRIPRVGRRLCVVLVVLGMTGSSALAQRTEDLRTEAYRLYDSGQIRAALPYLDALLSRKHRDLQALIKRGNCYLRLEQPARAVADFNVVIGLDPLYPVAPYHDRGIANVMLGQLDAARKRLSPGHRPRSLLPRRLETAPRRGATARGLPIADWAKSYHRLGQDEEAISEYNQAIELNPGDPNNYAGRGDAYAALNQLDPALIDYNEAIRLDPNHSRAFASRGDLLARKGEIDRGLTDLEHALQIDPAFVLAHRLHGALLSYLGQNEKALADFDALIKANPKDVGALKDRGGVLVRLGNYQRAIEDLDKALALEPRRVSALLNRGAAHNGLRQYESAIADLSEAIRLDSHHSAARTNRGLAYFALRQYEPAIEDLSEAVAARPEEHRCPIQPRRGLLAAGDVRQRRRAITTPPSSWHRRSRRPTPAWATPWSSSASPIRRSRNTTWHCGLRLRMCRSIATGAMPAGSAATGAERSPTSPVPSRSIPVRPTLYVSRGWARLIAGREGANDDASAYLDLRRGDKYAPYMAILGALAARRAGRDGEANAFLDAGLANIVSPGAWPAPILRYLKHTTTAADLLAAAGDDAQAAEAHAFAGIDLLSRGFKADALEHLRWLLDHAADRERGARAGARDPAAHRQPELRCRNRFLDERAGIGPGV